MKKHVTSSHTHLRCVSLCQCHSITWILVASKLLFSSTNPKTSPHNHKFSSFFFLTFQVFLIYFSKVSWWFLCYNLIIMKVIQSNLYHSYFLPSSIRFLGKHPLEQFVWDIPFTHSYSYCISCCYSSHTIKKMPCRFLYTLLALEVFSSHCPIEVYIIPSKGYAISAVICVVLLCDYIHKLSFRRDYSNYEKVICIFLKYGISYFIHTTVPILAWVLTHWRPEEKTESNWIRKQISQ